MNKDIVTSKDKNSSPVTHFADEQSQEVLPLDFNSASNDPEPVMRTPPVKSATIVNAGKNSPEKPAVIAETKPPIMEASPATAAKHHSLLQSEAQDRSSGETGLPPYRSAAYPPGYRRAERTNVASNTPAIGASADEKQEQNWRKNEIIERSEPERAAAAIQEKKNAPLSTGVNIQIDVHFGKLLNEARTRQNLSFQQVDDITKIRKEYLEALEREDFSRLPPPVFICAYVKKLCALYKVNPESTAQVVDELKKYMEVSLTEEIMNNIEIDRAKSPESEAKLRNLLWMGFAALIFFAGIVSLALLILFAPTGASTATTAVQANTAKAFDPARLEKLRPPESVGLSELPAKR